MVNFLLNFTILFDKANTPCYRNANEEKMASLKSIAEKCNVSITTVSRVLNNDKLLV